MNQIEIFREELETLAKHGRYSWTGEPQGEFSPAYPGVAKKVGEHLLERFPEKDTDHVRAYRALMVLADYAKKYNLHTKGAFYRDELPVEQQLLRFRDQIEPPAREDVLNRLDVDETEFGSRINHGMSSVTISDPVSKRVHEVSATEEQMMDNYIEQYSESLAQDVLHASV